MNYKDDQTEMQQIIETIRGYAIVMGSITIGVLLMYGLIAKISHI